MKQFTHLDSLDEKKIADTHKPVQQYKPQLASSDGGSSCEQHV